MKLRNIPELVKLCIANVFIHKLHSWIGETDMQEVVRLNATHEYKAEGMCATHNYCDASMAMIEAMESLGFDPLTNAESIQEEFDTMNEIWTMARNNDFQPFTLTNK